VGKEAGKEQAPEDRKSSAHAHASALMEIAAIPNICFLVVSRASVIKSMQHSGKAALQRRVRSPKIYGALTPAGNPVTITKDPNPTKIP
jgi:hypothetical protein